MTPKRILLVDDEKGFTHLLKLTLEKTGRYEVKEENDGTQAWLTARSFKPDIVFLDIVMPKVDGGDVAQKINSDPSLGNVKVVFMTAIVSEKESERDTIGGFPFLAKPVTFDAVVEAIEANVPDAKE